MDWGAIARYLGAGIAVGFGGMGAGIGEGMCAQEANAAIARQPKVSEQIVRTMLVAQAVAETPGIFALLVAFMLVFGWSRNCGCEGMRGNRSSAASFGVVDANDVDRSGDLAIYGGVFVGDCAAVDLCGGTMTR